jgi:hypothetical protein
MTTTKQDLVDHLQTALQLEFATIPPYLIALLSIKLPGNRDAAEIIRSVMIEEMLHLALIANILNAVGGKPVLDATTIPRYPLKLDFQGNAFKDRKFDVHLARFSPQTIQTFLDIEQPQEPPHLELALIKTIPVDGYTIGEFYSRIEKMIAELDGQESKALFSGDPARQVRQDFYWSGGGQIIEVDNAADARKALDLVIQQGEASHPLPGDRVQLASDGRPWGHYFRFKQIAAGKRYRETDNPETPTGPALDLDYSTVYPIVADPKAALYKDNPTLKDLNDRFNRRYTAMVRQLQEAFDGKPATLYTAIMDSMHALPPLAHEMMKLSVHGGTETGCPTFDWLLDVPVA